MKHFNLCLILLLFIFQPFSLKAQVYEYPVKPGSKAWKKFESTAQMIDACQIPADKLAAISTVDLLKSCLKYPLLNNYTASNSYKQGIDNIILSFNGLQEFLKRKDSHLALLNYYQKQNMNDIKSASDKGGYTFDFCALEILLTRDEIVSRFTNQQKKLVLQEIKLKYISKMQHEEDFGFLGKMTAAFVLIRYKQTLDRNFAPKNAGQKLFSEKMLLTELKVVDEILESI